jgi:hypothetical protein
MKNRGRCRLFFADAIFTYLGQFFLEQIIFFLLINLRSRCGQSFTNLARQMNVLYSAEQKGRPLGSQALMNILSKLQLPSSSHLGLSVFGKYFD